MLFYIKVKLLKHVIFYIFMQLLNWIIKKTILKIVIYKKYQKFLL